MGVSVGDIRRDENGGPMEPTPQREHPHAEGAAYPKKVSFVVSLRMCDAT